MNFRPIVSLACLGLIAIAPLTAQAHEFWLAPSRSDTPVEIRALAGAAFPRGEAKTWSTPHCVRFVAIVGRALDLTKAASPGDSVWARFAPSDEGGAMLAYESGFTSIELPAARFDAYLEEEGLDGPLAARREAKSTAAGRERYRRAAKTWLEGRSIERATTPVGLPLEIVSRSIPGAEEVLHARVLWQGLPLQGALVNAWRAPLVAPSEGDSPGVAWRGRTDSNGEVAIPVGEPGEWLVSLVHMVPCPDRSEADWESTWSSLTFRRAAAVPQEGISPSAEETPSPSRGATSATPTCGSR